MINSVVKSYHTANIILQGLSMSGHIRCAKCNASMSRNVCKCGGIKAFINVYWKGKHWIFRHNKHGEFLVYQTAERLLTTIRQAIDDKTFSPDDYTLSKIKERSVANQLCEWLDQRERDMNSNELAVSTYRHYRAYIKLYFKPKLGKLDMRELDFGALTQFKDWLAEKDIKIKTRRNVMNALHAFVRWTWQRGIIKAMPPFPEVQGDDAEVKYALERCEQDKMLLNIPAEHRDVFEFGFETGLRPGELCAVKVSDITRLGLIVQRTLSCGTIRETTKTKSKCTIPMSQRAMEIAQKHAAGKLPFGFLFTSPTTGKYYSTEFLRRLWAEKNPKSVTLYEAMRHSFCTQLIASGVDLATAQFLMRHADIRSTLAYFHANPARFQSIVENRGKVVQLNRNETETKTGTDK